MTRSRQVQRIIPALEASDGAGVRIRRSLGQNPISRADPFLMLDEFGSADPADYQGGFPPHPHRGFETVTYMLAGHMRHEDHMGNQGDLGPGDVQWMTAGRGIIHSEMPQQEDGLMHGFQLWLNLAAADKMQPARYRDIAASDIPVHELAGGSTLKLVAGQIDVEGHTLQGPVQSGTTQAVFADVRLPAGAQLMLPLAQELQALVYVWAGEAHIGDKAVSAQQAALLNDGDEIRLHNPGSDELRALVLAGKPLKEPVAQYGPFVMNTHAELEQAMQDYRDGVLTGEVQPA
nr:pirin family protein [Oceanococcus sp. HetDA_MAG_MS8]